MLCQNCGKNEANVRYTQIINGEKKEMILCGDCAKKLGINNFKINMPIHFSNFLEDLFDDYNDEQLLPSFIKEKHNECKNCGELYNEFIKTSLLGCPECYDMFGDRLDTVLKNIQGNNIHVGRKPLNIAEKMNNIGENDIKQKGAKTDKNPTPEKVSQKSNDLAKLQDELNQAIKEERYEDAAIIRDKIKKLNSEK